MSTTVAAGLGDNVDSGEIKKIYFVGDTVILIFYRSSYLVLHSREFYYGQMQVYVAR